MTRRLVFLGFLSVLLAALPTLADEDEGLTPDDLRAFDWLDKTGIPHGGDHPYVRVTRTYAGNEQREYVTHGFVLDEADARATILRDDLVLLHVAQEDVEAGTTRIERLGLAAVARERLALLDDPPERGDGFPAPGWPGAVVWPDARLDEASQLFVFARAVAAQGHGATAHRLLEHVRRLLKAWRKDGPELNLQEAIEPLLATGMLWRIILDFDDPDVPRKRLLVDLRQHVKAFPATEHSDRAKGMLLILERMVEEDERHVTPTAAEWAALPAAARAKELIFQLRDQDGCQMMQPGSPTIGLSWRGEGTTPGDRLVAMGYDAVPALIEALTDERFTRTVGYWRNFTFSHYVVRVGDAARVILKCITKQHFWSGTYTAASMHKDDEAKEVQDRYRAWWGETGAFLAPLKAFVAASDEDQCRNLARTLPDRGPGPIPGAPESAAWGRGNALEFLGVSTEQTIALFRLLLAESPHVRTQALAAWSLLDLGVDEGVGRMIGIWVQLDAERRVDALQGEHVAAFLAACGRPEAIRALAAGLDEQPAEVRATVLLAFWRRGHGSVRGLASDGAGLREPWTLEGEAARAAESLVAGCLEDLEKDPLGRIPRQEPIGDMVPDYDAGDRIADLASRVLALRWPGAYAIGDAPVHSKEEWEGWRTEFVQIAAERAD